MRAYFETCFFGFGVLLHRFFFPPEFVEDVSKFKQKKIKVTAVFCQTAIDSAQNDHAMMAQSILENKDWALLSVLVPPLVEMRNVMLSGSTSWEDQDPFQQVFDGWTGLDIVDTGCGKVDGQKC